MIVLEVSSSRTVTAAAAKAAAGVAACRNVRRPIVQKENILI
jgi:hypothetical protein